MTYCFMKKEQQKTLFLLDYAGGKTLAHDLAPSGIRVNTISPGPIETPIFGKSGMTVEEQVCFKESITNGIPLKRLGKANEIAQAALFFGSDDSSFIHGAEILVDGGLSFV